MRKVIWGFILLSSLSVFAELPAVQNILPMNTIIDEITRQEPRIPRHALEVALSYYSSHANSQLVQNRNFLSLVDFDQASTDERLFVVDMRSLLVQKYLVAHGKESGENYATRFSNIPQSNMSSVGIYLTGIEYIGQHGLSMVLKGQEITNSNAEDRAIVMHAADYVSPEFIAKYGRLGRSLGCFAVNPSVSIDLTNKLAGGSVIYAYYSGETSLIDQQP